MGSRSTQLLRYAGVAGALTVGLFVIWAGLSSIPGNTGIGIGWFLVLPMLFIVPLGALVTVVLLVAAGTAAATEQDAGKSSDQGLVDKSEPPAAARDPGAKVRSNDGQ